MESFMNSANCTSEEAAAVVPCADTLNDSLDEICSQSTFFSSPTSYKQKPNYFELAVGFKEGKVADSPDGILPSLPSPRPLSQQAAFQLNSKDKIVTAKRNDESTQPTASLPEKELTIALSQPSTSQTTSATKFVPSFGKKGPPKTKPKETNMSATKSQPVSNDGDTASSLERQLADEQPVTTKQTTEAQASKIKKKVLKKLSSNQNQVTKEEKDKVMTLKKQEKDQKKAEKEMLKMKKQLEKEEKQAEKERKQAEREQKQAEKQAEKELKQAEKERKQAEKEQKLAEKDQKQAEREQKQAEREQKQAEREQKQVEKKQKKAEREQKQVEKEQKKAEKEQKQVEKEQKQPDEKKQKQAKSQTEKEQKQAEKRQKKAEEDQKDARKQGKEESESTQSVEVVETPAPGIEPNQISPSPETEAATEICSAAEDLPADDDDDLPTEDLSADDDNLPTAPCDAASMNSIRLSSEHNMITNSNQNETSKPLGEHEDEEPTQTTSADKKNLLTSQQEGKQDQKNKFFKPPLEKTGTKGLSLPKDQQPAKKKVHKTPRSNQKNQHCRKSEERVVPSNTVGPVWVQCDHPDCLKWRVMNGVTDPALIPDKWYCSMNTDPEYSSCTVPEQIWSDPGEDEEFVYSQYVPGSIVWAKLEGFPWWPAMVEEDPDCESYYETKGSSHIPVKCHVVFLDTPVSRAWVHTLNIQSFTEDSKIPQKSTPLLTSAFKDAHKALEMTVKERLACYGFIARYKKQHHSATRQKRARSPTAMTSSNKARKRTGSKRSRRDMSAETDEL